MTLLKERWPLSALLGRADNFCAKANAIHTITTIDHFTVVGLVTWPLNGSEAGGDLVLIQTSLLLLCKSTCSYAI